MDVQLGKIGMVFNALHAQQVKVGMLQQDHVVVQLVKTGVEAIVFHALVADNGMLSQDNVFVLQETGMDFHVLHVLLVKLGILLVFHAHAQPQLSGTVLTVEHVQAQADIGIINLMIVFAEQVIGMEAAA